MRDRHDCRRNSQSLSYVRLLLAQTGRNTFSQRRGHVHFASPLRSTWHSSVWCSHVTFEQGLLPAQVERNMSCSHLIWCNDYKKSILSSHYLSSSYFYVCMHFYIIWTLCSGSKRMPSNVILLRTKCCPLCFANSVSGQRRINKITAWRAVQITFLDSSCNNTEPKVP